MIEFQFQAISVKPIIAGQAQGVISFGAQAHLLEGFAVYDRCTGHITFRFRILNKRFPIFHLKVNGMDTAVVKQPYRIFFGRLCI